MKLVWKGKERIKPTSQQLIIKDNGDARVVGPGLTQGNGRLCPYVLTDRPSRMEARERDEDGGGERETQGGCIQHPKSRVLTLISLPSLSWMVLREGGTWNGRVLSPPPPRRKNGHGGWREGCGGKGSGCPDNRGRMLVAQTAEIRPTTEAGRLLSQSSVPLQSGLTPESSSPKSRTCPCRDLAPGPHLKQNTRLPPW